MPFGEFVPWPLGLLAKQFPPKWAISQPGTQVVVSPVGEHQIGTFICYESVFPHFVRQFAAGGAEVLFNLSNDGWFGKSAARQQHLRIVRMRAAENQRWILRVHQRRHHRQHRSGRPRARRLPFYMQAAVVTGFRLSGAPDLLHTARRLVRAPLRAGERGAAVTVSK